MERSIRRIPICNASCAITVDKIFLLKEKLFLMQKNTCQYQKPFKFVAVTNQ